MQSWGTDSRFDIRFTGREPSKSGVIGLLCAALGKPREERAGDGFPPLTELAALRVGVRVDRAGTVAVDYHTAGGSHRAGERYGVALASGSGTRPVQSWRYYLADAAFLVGLEGDGRLLARLDADLRQPLWALSLGRKAFVPSVPVRLPDGGPGGPCWAMGLEDALGAWTWPTDGEERLPIVVECGPGDEAAETRRDVPVDFAARRFAVRYVRQGWVEHAMARGGDV